MFHFRFPFSFLSAGRSFSIYLFIVEFILLWVNGIKPKKKKKNRKNNTVNKVSFSGHDVYWIKWNLYAQFVHNKQYKHHSSLYRLWLFFFYFGFVVLCIWEWVPISDLMCCTPSTFDPYAFSRSLAFSHSIHH